ncbi:MAG: two-component system, OmpR family, response regulator ResD [Gaiellales bacterium]|nr:two-component system, OmpR family, response regulator ResD [Gaiellales bacterium]
MESPRTVLVVDDEPTVRDVVSQYLTRDGFRVVATGDGREVMGLVELESPALIVLDVMLPGIGGLELCRTIRARRAIPVILLTARGEETDRIVGLELGADDYVTKPFSPRELVARVRAVLRRSVDGAAPELLVLGDLEIDLPAREVRVGGRDVRLAAREFDLLAFLARNPRRVFTREQIMQSVWGYTAAIDTGTLSVHVRRLREKIEDDPHEPRRIETVWNVGYRLVA